MHLNYFFLKPLCKELDAAWRGFTLGACFSQQKDELIFHFYKNEEEKFIRVSLIPQLTFISFPESFARSRKNNVDLFEEAIGGQLEMVSITPCDRSFVMAFNNGFSFLFKMHGSRSNIIGTDKNGSQRLFRSQLLDDEGLTQEQLASTLALTKEHFDEMEGELRQFVPILGKETTAFLNGLGYDDTTIERKWALVTEMLGAFENPTFYICRWQEKVQLLLFRAGEVLMETDSAIEATTVYAQKVSREFYLKTELHPLLQRLRKELKQTESYLKQSKAKLIELKEGKSYSQLADVLMANLHQVKEGQEEAVLDNFYTGQPVNIKLKRALTPQKNAEIFYRKAKNQKIEIEKLEEAIAAKEALEETVAEHLLHLEDMTDLKLIRQYIQQHGLAKESKQAAINRPFKVFQIGLYEAWVGTNAKNNDELTLKYATKNDLWLHAKDVPGSHVVLKWRAGQNFPKPVIEQAAALAAYYSKRKTDTLCPVIFTPKKWVRKPKGAHPGAVIVEREEVIMVEPGLPN
ncbi:MULTISPECIES: NFACT RNA binding domain-containing protein [unclassified Imperialibacter]|uniref:NFACT RNA binding domain-containing protein n=1 Tax=unclassified Imperialibacter TaxID=2629706 RepID=UPI001255560A|nr:MULTISPECIES: NFACT RNA binding domain-containing protein [unclassified Imperialibacter]CAD5299314.1 conserved hypothetical protein [Imperialibacter sp. 89]CAD5299901.1 conserved hypothetical protein [Imperialibacter sp. 75]VVT15701.1 conserved hypothetical protein [Imperialibacter sp. EC-SDR9]